jgi:lactoylglutathione lyase
MLKNAWGYQGNAMSLPVASVDDGVPFYERVMGFRVDSRSDAPPRTVVLERDGIRMALTENGGDPAQDGCAFEVSDVQGIHQELVRNLNDHSFDRGSVSAELKIEMRDDGSSWKVFFVVAPDGLCYWFGEKQ